jgi:hypothetical protein
MSPDQLKTLAYAWSNTDKDKLEKAGVLKRAQVGGSDWKRFNEDPMTFIIKLPDDKLKKLSELLFPF